MSMIVRTMNSTYEVDILKKMVRRIFGSYAATERLGEEWKEYQTISELVVGKPLQILWGIDDVSVPGQHQILFRTTITSEICEILDAPLKEIHS